MRSRRGTRRRSGSFKLEAERKFKHKVDFEVPALGLGSRLTEMIVWCRENVTGDHWATHGYMESMTPEGQPKDYARFYFTEYAVAEEFAERFAGTMTGSVRSYRAV